MGDTPHIRPLVAGNWKMNGLRASLEQLSALKSIVQTDLPQCDVLICPPFTLISQAAIALNGTVIALGSQDCHANTSGAHTGDVSADMVADMGASYAIVGHSERRADHGESSELVSAKAQAAIGSGLTAIICVGETQQQRDAGETLSVIESQLKDSLPPRANAGSVVIAYEPVWAIGTGLTPSADDVAEVHAYIRGQLESLMDTGSSVRILYGGSVKAANAGELMDVANVNGALVGGASLKASDFNGILDAYRR